MLDCDRDQQSSYQEMKHCLLWQSIYVCQLPLSLTISYTSLITPSDAETFGDTAGVPLPLYKGRS